ncbi:MarR family winged helix-turn-helix transcriptional regulator [Couchioplanes azureus]|uniref:MarR family winged helix-turn-helix transcriptional regulator n=1 Tax=Couchioplanes caeruleus TaxID=56438 RepID=UPI00166F7D63|nr:MarR family winged helix-turn-helix transcriptional regulator [Couchioplanes caeruleus]GGQ83794.1 hypothetical protein GCM10010166_62480 [Couchioplanes caeruleus subsp. azureus]
MSSTPVDDGAPHFAEPANSRARRPGKVDDGDIVSALCRTANLVRQHLEHTVLRPADLIWTTYDVLHLVVAHRTIATRTVAATNGISKSTVTVAVRTLSARGLIRRSVDPGDHRHVLLRPTSVGWQVLHEVRPRITEEQQRLLVGQVPGLGARALAVLRATAEAHGT